MRNDAVTWTRFLIQYLEEMESDVGAVPSWNDNHIVEELRDAYDHILKANGYIRAAIFDLD